MDSTPQHPGSSALRVNTKAAPILVAGVAVITGLGLTLWLMGLNQDAVVGAGLGLFLFVGTAIAVALEHQTGQTPR